MILTSKKSWINPKIQIKNSPIGGRGMFALKKINSGEDILTFGGDYIDKQEALEEKTNGKLVMQWDEDLFTAENRGDDETYFLNHSCDGNTWMKDAFSLIAHRDILPGEEVTADYVLWEANEKYVSKWLCKCGSPKCRGRATGVDWRQPELQERYWGHFSPLINKRITKNNQMIFEPQNWHTCHNHDWQTCSLNANCYSYALNRPEYFWSVPGMGFAKAEAKKYIAGFNNYFKGVSLIEYHNELLQGAVRDGLLPIHEPLDREGYYLAALFFAKNEYDFHWFRKDNDGLWSHKNGWHTANNKDDNGNFINLPAKTTCLPYSIFGSFFLIPREGIELKQNFPI